MFLNADLGLPRSRPSRRHHHRRGRDLQVTQDKPICKLRTTVARHDGVVAVEGTAVTYTTPLTRE